MNFNIEKVPFSRFGSYFAISKIDGICYLRDLHCGDESPSNLFKLTLLKDGVPVDFSIDANEYRLIFSLSEGEYVKFVFGEKNMVNILTYGLSLKIEFIKSRYDSFFPIKKRVNTYHYDFYTKEIKMDFSLISGDLELISPWKYVGNEKILLTILPNSYLVIEEYKTVKEEKIFKEINFYEDKVKEEFENFKNGLVSGAEEMENLAAYIMWSCVVHKEGLLKHDAMYMSKNFMNNIWSWDNMFNAMALSYAFPQLSYGQLNIFMDYQDDSGCYPDFINDKYYSFNCVKPPISCWAFKNMRKNNIYFNNKEILNKVYFSLKKQIIFWINHRVLDDISAPVYFHGNDSGWDNSSVFHEGMPVESPDLLGLLVRELDIMAELSQELNFTSDREFFNKKAEYFFNMLINEFYVDDKFLARSYNTKEFIKNESSLILRLPIIIGYRLERNILDKLVTDIEENFLVQYGLLTESKNSPFYKQNGYWLGSIWAAPTLMIYLALKENGYNKLSLEIKNKFKKLVKKGGMSENFDGYSGAGYSDPAFTWTSGIYLYMLKN